MAEDLVPMWAPDCPSQLASWADDLSIPLESRDAAGLTSVAATTTSCAKAALQTVGLAMNFQPGKTEALLMWRGVGSRDIRRSLLACDAPSIPVVLRNGCSVKLALTRDYTHLGGVVRDDDGQQGDLERRRCLAQSTFAKLRKSLLFNPHLSASEKLNLVFSLVHRKFLHGAGFWKLASRRDGHVFHTAIGQWYRSCIRPVLGLSSRGLTDEEVCEALGVMNSSEILSVERSRLLLTAARFGEGALRAVLRSCGDWASLAMRDAALVFGWQPDSFCQLMMWLAGHVNEGKAAVKAFRRACLQKRASVREETMRHARWLQGLHRSGGITFRIGSAAAVGIASPRCGLTCSTKASLASHRSRVHGEHGATAFVNGTCCQRCGTEYWTTARLRLHLRKCSQCRLAHLGSDITYAKWEFSDQAAMARRPAVKVQSVAPFWATLTPDDVPLQAAMPSEPLSLRRHLKHDDLALLFKALVTEGSMPHGSLANFDSLIREVQQGGESRAPSLIAIITMAKAAAQAASMQESLTVQQEGFSVVLQGSRCTLQVL